MRKWLLWWSQIRGCFVCLTRGDKAWNSPINSMCPCRMESSPALLRWDNFWQLRIRSVSWFGLFLSLSSPYTQKMGWPSSPSKLLPTFAAAQCNCCFSQLPAPQWEVNVSPYQIYFEDKLPAGKNTHICLLVVITNGRFEGGLGHISHISVAITHHPILKVLLLTCMKYVCSSSSRRCQYLCVIRV